MLNTFRSIVPNLIAWIAWMGRNGILLFQIFAYPTVTAMHFKDLNWIPKTVYCFHGVSWFVKYFFAPDFSVFRRSLGEQKTSKALLRASMVVTYYIKLFSVGADRHKGMLMSFLLLVEDTIRDTFCFLSNNSAESHKLEVLE